jgi:hypothetical protein
MLLKKLRDSALPILSCLCLFSCESLPYAKAPTALKNDIIQIFKEAAQEDPLRLYSQGKRLYSSAAFSKAPKDLYLKITLENNTPSLIFGAKNCTLAGNGLITEDCENIEHAFFVANISWNKKRCALTDVTFEKNISQEDKTQVRSLLRLSTNTDSYKQKVYYTDYLKQINERGNTTFAAELMELPVAHRLKLGRFIKKLEVLFNEYAQKNPEICSEEKPKSAP